MVLFENALGIAHWENATVIATEIVEIVHVDKWANKEKRTNAKFS